MAEVEQTSQPEGTSGAGSAAVAAFQRLQAEMPEPAPEADVSTAQAAPVEPVEAPQSPATLIIPLSRVPEKFRSKPEAIVEAYENAEKWGTQNAQEASRLRKETDELRARLAAAEQVSRMNQTPQAPPQTSWQKAGINPQEDIIVAPERVAAHVIEEAKNAARQEAKEAAAAETAKFKAERQSEDQTRAIFWALDEARRLAKNEGYEFSDEHYKQLVTYVGPAVAEEAKQNPNAPFDPTRYVEHIRHLKGAPARPTLPTEGVPPVAAKSATVRDSSPTPTLSREDAQLNRQIRAAMGLK